MKNIIFIEGVSGVGKTTMVSALGKKLQELGDTVSCYFEGEPDSPLDLCWTAYLTRTEYEYLMNSYPELSNEPSTNIISIGDCILLRYQVGRIKLYSPELHNVLQKHEFCYKPTHIVPLSVFTEVFLNLWHRYIASNEVNKDYAIFDASLSHMINDLVRNYSISEDEMVKYFEILIHTIDQLHPIVIYLSSNDVDERLIMARQSRGQIPPSNEQSIFWKKRKQKDSHILSRLSVETYIKDISDSNWDSVIEEIVVDITKQE